jgi:hypothetical protein
VSTMPRDYVIRLDRDFGVGLDDWIVCVREYEPGADIGAPPSHQTWLAADGAQWLGTQILLAGVQSELAGNIGNADPEDAAEVVALTARIFERVQVLRNAEPRAAGQTLRAILAALEGPENPFRRVEAT